MSSDDPLLHNVTTYDAASDNPTCVVCMDDFEAVDQVLRLPCHHSFHPDCIRKWLTECKPCCPMCQKNLLS
jgi:hypothetical protein